MVLGAKALEAPHTLGRGRLKLGDRGKASEAIGKIGPLEGLKCG
jgi:hypothetical protein